MADHYLLEMDFSQTDYLRLRDHGCEIIGGLSELFLTLHYINHPKLTPIGHPFTAFWTVYSYMEEIPMDFFTMPSI